jgi:hypothetical protein
MQNHKLNNFFQNIFLKKQYISQLKNKILYLNSIKKNSYALSNQNEKSLKQDYIVKYIIDITFSKTNTLLHVMDFSGNLKFFCSAGDLNYKGKNKIARWLILKHFYKVLVLKLKFLTNQPIALHLKNIRFDKFWIFKKFKKKFFIKTIKIFKSYSYNGCRNKKIRRKKIRTKK